MVDNICDSVCDILRTNSALISQQRKDMTEEFKRGACSQSIINRGYQLDGKRDIIATIVDSLDRKNICKCHF